ncbi:MAG: cobalt-precorrin-6A reductase [Kastovskya adunca ATA6-11-RM4]|jgi:precorrin-6A/cobalt-precorrin-6A reductase|nr:cobalt-precorrin-6A reductase [Kastovskya adunca ATA6-11-RM4]
MVGRLWLIGGTTESAQLAKAIAALQLPCTVTVTTAAATALYPQCPHLQIVVGRLDDIQLARFCKKWQITAILDASHPYAIAVSKSAITLASQYQIPYLRFERPTLETSTPGLIHLDSFETLINGNYLEGQRVLLTVGYKALPLFKDWRDRATLFARILPSVASLEAALAAGFTADRIIAFRPPIPSELEKALWRHWDISLVVTKASGKAGGEAIKRTVAAELAIPLVVIARPEITYPQQTSDVSVALEFCQTRGVGESVSPGF